MFLIANANQSIQWDMIIGGFALFLFGIEYMGDGLKSIAGDKLKDYIERYTNKPWKGILVGSLITMIIQSSSATTAICIGFVRAGIMRLEQAVGIIMGANIGTTVTAFLIGMNVESLALYFVFAGVLFFLFGKRKKQRYIGQAVLGFGLLFFGLKMMGDQLELVGELPQFASIAEEMAKQPILGMLCGIVMTGIIQSSSAVIGIVQNLYATGSLQLIAVLPFVFGSNIGTTVTAIFAAIGGSTAAKRTAGIHVLFNVVGSLLFMCFLHPVKDLILYLAGLWHLDPQMQIAVVHIIFNITIALLFYPFIKYMVKFVKVIIRGEDDNIDIDANCLDEKLIETLPSAAIQGAQEATYKMAKLAKDVIKDTDEFLDSKSGKIKESARQLEDAINTLDSKITSYLIKISHESINQNDSDNIIKSLQVVKNLERIGDISMNLVEFYDNVFDAKHKFSPEALKDMHKMSNVIQDMLEYSIAYYMSNDKSAKKIVQEYEDKLDRLESKARQRHFERLANNECTSEIASSIYVDILSNLERMGDHCENIIKVLDSPSPGHEIVSEENEALI